MEPKLVPIISGKHPAQLFLMGLCVVSGLNIMLGGPEPTSVEAVIQPQWLIYIWGLGLFVGGAVALLAVFARWRDIVNGLVVEAVAMVQMAVSGSIHSTAILLSAEDQGKAWQAAATIAVFVFMGVWRAVQIFRTLRELRTLQQEVHRAVDG